MSFLVNFSFALGLAESVPNEAAGMECSSFFTGFFIFLAFGNVSVKNKQVARLPTFAEVCKGCYLNLSQEGALFLPSTFLGFTLFCCCLLKGKNFLMNLSACLFCLCAWWNGISCLERNAHLGLDV